MYEHLKVFGSKGLKLAKLLKLGKINVICGKNNSGKSSLLHEIDNKNFEIGLIFDEDAIEEINDSFTGVSFNDGYSGELPSKDQFQFWYKDIVNKLLTDEVFFISDNEIFVNQVEKNFYKSGNSPAYQLRRNDILHSFNSKFNAEKMDSISLPPKRVVESNERNTRFELLKNNGEWLLNYLFLAKNQSDDSKEFRLYQELKNVFCEITSGYSFDLVSGISNQEPREYLVSLKFKSDFQDNWIDAADCGLGLRDLIIILYFAIVSINKVVIIEEPENHIHPEMQRRLLRFLKEETDKQYFIATHSNIFLDPTYSDRVFMTKFEDGEVKVEDATNRTEVLSQLGYSIADNLTADLVILTEGKTDIPVITEFIAKKPFELDAKYNIKTWSLGGDNMGNHDLTVFTEVIPPERIIAVVDNEPDKREKREEFKKKCEDLGIECCLLDRFSTESYFTIRALKETFNKYEAKYSALETLTDKDLKTDESIWGQIGMPKKIKECNRKIAKEMTVEEIKDTDFYDFFEKVREKCETSKT